MFTTSSENIIVLMNTDIISVVALWVLTDEH